MIPIPIPTPYKIAAAGVAAVALFAAGFTWGFSWRADTVAELKSTISQMEETYAALEKKHEEQRLVQERIVEDVSQRWADAVAWNDAHPRTVRVRENCSGASAIPGLSVTRQKADGLQASGRETWITTDRCEGIANDSMIDREWIILMKDFVTKQHEASK